MHHLNEAVQCGDWKMADNITYNYETIQYGSNGDKIKASIDGLKCFKDYT